MHNWCGPARASMSRASMSRIRSASVAAFLVFAAMVRDSVALRAAAVASSTQQSQHLWSILEDTEQVQAWKTVFGDDGERGEYMDGYSEQAMLDRCVEDYRWRSKFSPELFASQRAKMMSHLYDNQQLWDYVCMVGFADHYVLSVDEDIAKPFDTFQRQKQAQPAETPIFGGVVLRGWDIVDEGGAEAVEKKMCAFKAKGIDYIRLECSLGSPFEIGGAECLPDNSECNRRLCRLAEVARACQRQEMVPLVLLQVHMHVHLCM